MVEGPKALALFALVMILIAMLMLKARSRIWLAQGRQRSRWANMRDHWPCAGDRDASASSASAAASDRAGLMLATGHPIMNALSPPGVAVTAFGMTTAAI